MHSLREVGQAKITQGYGLPARFVIRREILVPEYVLPAILPQ